MSVTGKLRALRERSGLSMAQIAKRARYQKPIYANGTGAESVKIIGVVVGFFQQVPLPPTPIR